MAEQAREQHGAGAADLIAAPARAETVSDTPGGAV